MFGKSEKYNSILDAIRPDLVKKENEAIEEWCRLATELDNTLYDSWPPDSFDVEAYVDAILFDLEYMENSALATCVKARLDMDVDPDQILHNPNLIDRQALLQDVYEKGVLPEVDTFDHIRREFWHEGTEERKKVDRIIMLNQTIDKLGDEKADTEPIQT